MRCPRRYKGVTTMAELVPFDRYDRALHRAFDPFFDFMDDFPTVINADHAAFKMNVEDADDKYVVSAQLPGVKKDQIDVELNEGTLTISVDKKDSDEEKSKNYLHRETSEWSATRQVYLKDAATQCITAKLADGVLNINVPKCTNTSNATQVAID